MLGDCGIRPRLLLLTWSHGLVSAAAEKGVNEEGEHGGEEASYRWHPGELRIRQRLRNDHHRDYDAGSQVSSRDIGEIGSVGSQGIQIADSDAVLRQPVTYDRSHLRTQLAGLLPSVGRRAGA